MRTLAAKLEHSEEKVQELRTQIVINATKSIKGCDAPKVMQPIWIASQFDESHVHEPSIESGFLWQYRAVQFSRVHSHGHGGTRQGSKGGH